MPPEHNTVSRTLSPCWLALFALAAAPALADGNALRTDLTLTADAVLATGNEWLSLPTIRARDGALENFNVLSMRARGLLQVDGGGAPALAPIIELDGKARALTDLHWELLDYWIPVAHTTIDGVQLTLTYCAPPGSRAALVHVTALNHQAHPVTLTLGMQASWGSLSRVTYTAVPLRGTQQLAPAPWQEAAESFSFVTDDTQFTWVLGHPGAVGEVSVPPAAPVPTYTARKTAPLGAGAQTSADFVIGVGVEEFSASHNAKTLRRRMDSEGVEAVIADAAAWCHQRTRTTGQPDLDALMNRNLLFTMLYAWGRTLDTEQFVGVTSRSPRYYVSAAYWDRDAMLWSFPALLDADPQWAREALTYALTTQLRDTGTHSRFIDGIVLEDGFQLDEAAAPLVALHQYVLRTGDAPFLTEHRAALDALVALLRTRRDAPTGLYRSVQDSQDENRRQEFMTYDNVLTWRALMDGAQLYERLGDRAAAARARGDAASLAASIRSHLQATPPGASGPIYAFGTHDGQPLFDDVPPGSLLKLPLLHFVDESDPVFARTYDWLHSAAFAYAYADQPYGLPGSYRLPFTTSWSAADHLRLRRGAPLGLKVLRASAWDAGIISEGIDPATAVMNPGGGAFATAAGYIADAICQQYCLPRPTTPPEAP